VLQLRSNHSIPTKAIHNRAMTYGTHHMTLRAMLTRVSPSSRSLPKSWVPAKTSPSPRGSNVMNILCSASSAQDP
jgi:hypothetical protein